MINDDDELFQLALCRGLTAQGFSCAMLAAPIGAQARLIDGAEFIDVTIPDCVMPALPLAALPGALPVPTLLAMLATNEIIPGIPVVLIAGMPTQRAAAAAAAAAAASELRRLGESPNRKRSSRLCNRCARRRKSQSTSNADDDPTHSQATTGAAVRSTKARGADGLEHPSTPKRHRCLTPDT